MDIDVPTKSLLRAVGGEEATDVAASRSPRTTGDCITDGRGEAIRGKVEAA
ncbi:MAG: hypothetical protein KIT84_17595 [Labilithrix sp.]|nr:hypothetical protein [Labilithrix sp.]MCW5812847.1 hypothetical protein [Labilithrix sp.]